MDISFLYNIRQKYFLSYYIWGVLGGVWWCILNNSFQCLYYIYFYTFFHSHVFSKNTNNVTRTMLPNKPKFLVFMFLMCSICYLFFKKFHFDLTNKKIHLRILKKKNNNNNEFKMNKINRHLFLHFLGGNQTQD